MKILTVSLLKIHIRSIMEMVGKDGLHPSRSELIRVALREFLVKELVYLKNKPKYTPNLKKDSKYVRIPLGNREFKRIKVVNKKRNPLGNKFWNERGEPIEVIE